ncbi:MAG: hypothetical protein AAB011_02740 [Candidatus Eisenbacteria bacterium]
MTPFVIPLVALVASALTFFSGFGLGTLLLSAFALFYPEVISLRRENQQLKQLVADLSLRNPMPRKATVGGARTGQRGREGDAFGEARDDPPGGGLGSRREANAGRDRETPERM